MATKPQYGKKPMSKQDLAKKGGVKTVHTFEKHRKGGDPFGNPKNWKPKK